MCDRPKIFENPPEHTSTWATEEVRTSSSRPFLPAISERLFEISWQKSFFESEESGEFLNRTFDLEKVSNRTKLLIQRESFRRKFSRRASINPAKRFRYRSIRGVTVSNFRRGCSSKCIIRIASEEQQVRVLAKVNCDELERIFGNLRFMRNE